MLRQSVAARRPCDPRAWARSRSRVCSRSSAPSRWPARCRGRARPPALSAQSPQPETTPQTDASVPASEVTMIGATPEEPGAPGPNETWGVGPRIRHWHRRQDDRGDRALRRRVAAGRSRRGSTQGRSPASSSSRRPARRADDPARRRGARRDLPKEGGGRSRPCSCASRAAPSKTAPAVTVESETPQPGEEPLLHKGETLFGAKRAPLIAPLEEEGGEAGALRRRRSAEGSRRSRTRSCTGTGTSGRSEPIEMPTASSEELPRAGDRRELAHERLAAGPALLQSSYPAGAVALFRRVHEGEGEPRSGAGSRSRCAPAAGDGKPHPLTVPVQGGGGAGAVHGRRRRRAADGRGPAPDRDERRRVDRRRTRGRHHAHAGVRRRSSSSPAGEARGRPAWKRAGASCRAAPAGRRSASTNCPKRCPSGYVALDRLGGSEAGGPFGERVITGLPEGVSLRLEGESFTRVLALGGGDPANSQIPGAQLGAAFSRADARAGWATTGCPCT